MKKKYLLVVSLLVFVFLVLIYFYFHFQPKKIDLVKKDIIHTDNNSLDYSNIEEHILEDEEIHYLWICSLNSDDCSYVKEYVINPLSNELGEGVNDFEKIEFVDFSEAPNTVHYRFTHWGINYYPAFIACRNKDNTIEILNVLAWNKDETITKDDLRTWMYENNIWSGDYNESEKIEG